MAKIKTPLIIILIIGIIILFKFLLFPDLKKDPGTSKAGSKAKIGSESLSGIIVHPQLLENILDAEGTLIANEEVLIQPETSGKVTELLMKEGRNVKKGQLLLKINDQDLRANLVKLKSNLNLAIQNEQREKKLLSINAISQQEYDSAKNVVESTAADIEFTKATIRKTEVTAPFDGRVGLRYVSVGSYVSPTTRIATIEQLNPIKLDFSVPEQYASKIKPGDLVYFTIQGVKNKYQAHISAIEPKIDINTRTLQLRAILKNDTQPLLMPGTFAEVKLVLKATSNAMMVPTQAIVPVLKGQTVYLYKKGKALQVVVGIGVRTDTQIQVISGVSLGDTIITSGLLSIHPGDSVKLHNLN